MKFLLVAINAKYIHSNPALYSLKAYADAHSDETHNIKICEFTINNLIDDILDEIYLEKPDFIGFSCYIWNISYVNMLIHELKSLLPDTHIWCGGPEVSYCAEEYLSKHKKALTGIMCGEGEATFLELVNYYSNTAGKTLDNINGITYINNNNIVSTPSRDVIDMNQIPFLYDNISDFENRIIYYESSRGCPFSCSYCLSSVDKCLRYRDINTVKKELLFFIDNNVPQVKFIDRTFNCNRDRATEIWQFIHEHDNSITNFHFEIAADLLDDSQLELLKHFRPGLIQLEIGVQSTNQKTLKEIRRYSDIKKLADNVARINEYNNIHQHLDLIAGLPYENYESFKQSFCDVYAMNPDQLQLGFLKVLSGSYIKDNSKEYGIKYKSYPPYEVLSTSWISYDEILKLKTIENMVEIYYNSHQFDNTIKYLEQFFKTPFDMYEQLGQFYNEQFDTKAKHSRISRYNLLLDFCKTLSDADINKIKQLLTLDVYLREKIKSRPAFACDLSIYQENITALKRKYNLSNHEHVEVFIDDNNEPVYVHFDYSKRNPLNGDAKLCKLFMC